MSAAPRVDDMKLSRERVETARSDQTGRVFRVYCDGIFDLFHVGHMNMLRQAKHALGDPVKTHLIVGVCDDAMTYKYKGKTVLEHKIRCDSCGHCKWVDEVAPDAPWVITDEFIEKYKIDFVAHDAIPYTDTTGSASSSSDVYGHIKEKGMFLETQRTNGISTSDILVKIVRDYDEYVRRNLDRGYTPQELNLDATWKLRNREYIARKKLKTSLTETKQAASELGDAVERWAEQFVRRRDRSLPRQRILGKTGIFGRFLDFVKRLFALVYWALSYVSPLSYFSVASLLKFGVPPVILLVLGVAYLLRKRGG
jgi:choline-phosphate cytidylyltransferase